MALFVAAMSSIAACEKPCQVIDSDSERADEHCAASVLVGLLGGLGPASSAAFTQRMVQAAQAAGATQDNHHVPFMLFSNPRLPNARLAALGQGPSPVPGYCATFRALAAAGCTHVGSINNTGHTFAREAANQLSIPLVDMIHATAQRAVQVALSGPADSTPGQGACESSTGTQPVYYIGLLATDATVQMGLYQDAIRAAAFSRAEAQVCVLSPSTQQLQAIQRCIDAAKAGKIGDIQQDTLLSVLSSLVARGCSTAIAGCTELPLMLQWTANETCAGCAVPVIDPLMCLATRVTLLSARTPVPAAGTEGASCPSSSPSTH